MPKGGETIRRRRLCSQCGERFGTIETIIPSLPLVVKKDGSKENFDAQKVYSGIKMACAKRPVTEEQIEAIVQWVEKWVATHPKAQIPSREIGQRVVEKLKQLDNVAYVRFCSVYRTFEDVEEFVQSLGQDFSPTSGSTL